jgi:diguanylate cyclase (GGDEF)-like protein
LFPSEIGPDGSRGRFGISERQTPLIGNEVRRLMLGARNNCPGRHGPVATIATVAAFALAAAGVVEAAQDPTGAAGADTFPVSVAVGLAVLTAAVLIGSVAAMVISHGRSARAEEDTRRLESVFDVLEEGIVICSGMQVVVVNASFCRLIDVATPDAQGVMISNFIHDADVIDRLLSETEVGVETHIHGGAGQTVAVEITARTIAYAGAQRRLLEIRDIRDRKTSHERISYLAHHDALTTLPNRELLRTQLAAAVARASESGQRCAVIWIDLDRFKEINDLHGHEMGDRILRSVAEKLRFELPTGTLIARLGGDEFVVVCEHISDPTEARLIAQQLRRLLNRPVDLGGWTTTTGASIGVAVYPDDGASDDELLKNADLALYQAKAEGRARCRHFTAALGKERQRRVTLIEQLRKAIDREEIEAYFQPIVRSSDRRVVALEALARWFHPEFGSVPPFEFVRIAEETGQIDRLTDLILRRAIEAGRIVPDNVRMAVNISPVQINSELVDRVRDAIKSNGFDPRRLELEVTEDVLIKDFDQTASMFARLRALGIQVAMDDFGAGYTSLGNLRRLNFDRIKIDRIFTTDLPSHRRSAAIVRAMLVLARELHLEVTIEGVETAEQLAFLIAEGADELQGFLFSQPKPLAALGNLADLQLGPSEAMILAPAAPVFDLGDARRSKRAG